MPSHIQPFACCIEGQPELHQAEASLYVSSGGAEATGMDK